MMLVLAPTVRRVGVFTLAVVATTIFGRLVGLQDSELAIFWPAIGVIALWVLIIQTRTEYAAFVVSTLAAMTAVLALTGLPILEGFMLAAANLVAGLVIRWTSAALVPVGRRLGLGSRYEYADASVPVRTIIRRMTTPYDVFRLLVAAFTGASVSWVIAAVMLTLKGDAPSFAEGGVWTIRTVANVLMIAGTGLVLLSRTRDPRPSSNPDLLVALGLTTALAVSAYLISPFVPLVFLVLIPLFWSAVRCTPSVAAGHALYTVALVGMLGWASEGMAIGDGSEMVTWAVRVHQVMIVAYLISLVVATAINEFARLNADLTDVAATAERSALELRTVNETIPDALISVGRDGIATPLNAAGGFFVATGPDGQSRLVRSRDGRFSPEDSGGTPSARALRGQTVRAHRFVHVDDSGTERAFELTASPLVTEDGDEPDRALLLIRDVTEHHRVLRELEVLAESDPLTGLLNRRRFDRELTRFREDPQRDRHRGGVLTVDLDRFKVINDTFGHAKGDEVIKSVARILTSTTGPSEVVTRLGGDEFAILVPDADRDQLHTMAETILDRIQAYAGTLDGAGRKLSASIGGVTFEAADEDDTAPLLVADSALYEVKHSGRDGALIVGRRRDPGHRTRTRAEWKDRLEQALESDELRLHLQPIISVGPDTVVGAEVLVRLLDEGTLISPAEFVPVAERAGIATSLDRWVIREAVALAARLRELDPHFTVWINISGQSIGNKEIEHTLLTCLDTHGVPASAVVLELTETTQIDDVPAARSQALRLREAGIRLAIDDFGTGFGSFVYLRHLLFDYVKIDGQFVTDMDTSATDRILVRSIVGLADQLQMEVVAENVETDAVLHLVHKEGIHLAQGYGIGRPCPEDMFVPQYLKQATTTR